MKNILFFCAILFCNFASAQQHKFDACRLSRNYKGSSENLQCQACGIELRKEAEARDAELKARKIAEQARLAAEDAARKKAANEAFELRQKQIREETEAQKKSELAINVQPATQTTNKKAIPEADSYTVEIVDWLERGPHLCKIKKDGKVVYETREYARIDHIHGQLLFFVTPYEPSGCRNDPKKNNQFLIDPTGKTVVIGGIEKFAFLEVNNQDRDKFEIVVYTGVCSGVSGDSYSRSRWATQRHNFSFATRRLIGTEQSAQMGKCSCGEY